MLVRRGFRSLNYSLVDEVSQMKHVVNRILARRIAERSKETKVVVGTRIDSKADSCSVIIGTW